MLTLTYDFRVGEVPPVQVRRLCPLNLFGMIPFSRQVGSVLFLFVPSSWLSFHRRARTVDTSTDFDACSVNLGLFFCQSQLCFLFALGEGTESQYSVLSTLKNECHGNSQLVSVLSSKLAHLPLCLQATKASEWRATCSTRQQAFGLFQWV